MNLTSNSVSAPSSSHSLGMSVLSVCLLGTAFCLFFQVSKHWPPLSAVNPFSEDPYDSVGSFAVQFVLFSILLSLLRSFPGSLRGNDPRTRQLTQARCPLMACIAVGFTLIADLIAMARHPSQWMGTAAGLRLLSLAAVLLLWTGAVAALVLASARAWRLSRTPSARLRMLAVPALAIFVLAVYPERLRQSFWGEIATVLCGVALLFIVVWAMGTALIPAGKESAADLFDDLASVAQSIPRRFGAQPRSTAVPAKTNRVAAWLNPRRRRWSLVLAAGMLFGAVLVGQELAEGGASPHGRRRLLVIAVYLGLETAGIAIGYALLARPLHLFRESN